MIKHIFSSFILFSLLFLTPITSNAQNHSQNDDIASFFSQYSGNVILPSFKKTNIVGTPYFTKDFTKGSLVLYTKGKIDGLSMNFNAYENTIEYKHDDKYYALPSEDIKQFTLIVDGQKYHFKRGYESRKLNAEDFVEVAAEGKVTFLIKHEVSYHQSQNTSYGSTSKENIYRNNNRYYFKKGDSITYLKKLNKRKVLRFFDNSQFLQEFIDSNNLDLSDEKDVKKIVTEYNNSIYES